MRAPQALLIALVIILAACSAPATVLPAGPVASASLLGATPATATPVPPAQTLTPLPTASPVPAARVLAMSPVAAGRANAANVPAVPFNIGVPAGDAYSPYSLALDHVRNLAYVYHADSAEKRPVISVVDLTKGQVTRLIRLDATTPGASGRLFLTPDGKRLVLQENQNSTVLTIDTGSGALHKILDGAHDAVMSEDGRVLYAAHEGSVAAYSLTDLTLERTSAIWQSAGRYRRLALNGQRLLGATYEKTGALVSLDAATGKEVARRDTPDSADAVSAGPNGGWAIGIGGERPRLIRYDAALKPTGETPIPYISDLSFDTARDRYLVGGQRYSEAEPRGHPVIVAIDAGDGKALTEERWPGETAPTSFVPWGADRLMAFSAGGPGILDVLDAVKLSSTARIPTGASAEDMLIDDEAGNLYVADDLGRIHVLKLPGGEEVAVWEGSSPFALDTANRRVYANRNSGVVALDTRTGAVLAQFPQRGYPAPDPSADLVYIADNGVTIYDRSGKRLSTLPSTFPVEHGFVPNPYAYAAQVNPLTGHVAVIFNNGIPGSNGGSFLRIYPRQSDKAVEPTAPHSFVMDVKTDRQGNWYVAYSTARSQDAVKVLSPDGKELRRLDHRTGYLALDEAKDNLYLFLQGRATRLQASTLTATGVFQAPEDATTMVFSPSAKTAYLAGFRGPVVTPAGLDSLKPLDVSSVPGRPPAASSNGSISVVGDGGKRLIFAQYSEPYRTDGAAWQRLLPGAAMLFSNITTAGPKAVFVTGQSYAGGEGVWRSTDGGDTWDFLTAGLTDLSTDGGVRANSANEAYLVNPRQGLLRWDPAGQTWRVVSAPEQQGQWGPLSLAPDGALFRANDGYLERSSDRGSTWTKLGKTEKTGDIVGYSALYTTTHTLFSVVRSSYRIAGLQHSTDQGKTWQPSIRGAPLDFDGYQPEMATGFGRSYLLLQPYNGASTLLRSTDFGDTWQAAPAGAVDGVDHIAVDPLDGRLWLGVKGGVRSLEPEKLRWTNLAGLQPSGAAAATPAATRAATASTKTPAPTSTAGPCGQALTGNDAEINQRSLGLGCPRGPAESVQMARQKFQDGQMIWRGDRKWIYVLHNDGRWEGYPDRWIEGEPADDPALIPPAGLQQPARGFGKVWRDNLGGQKAGLGWALQKEQGVLGQTQDWDFGTVMRFGGETIVLFDRGTWR